MEAHPVESIRPAEKMLIEQSMPIVEGARLLCTTLGRAQLAAALAERLPQAKIDAFHFDRYAADQSQTRFDASSHVRVLCDADFPQDEPYDLIALPLTHDGNAELTQEMLQEAHKRLALGGTLLAATDFPRDTWLQSELERLGERVERFAASEGAWYRLRKSKPLRKQRDFRFVGAFRDRERLVRFETRPGVFSHRKLDLGARALLEAIEVSHGERLFEIGCGSGAVSIAAALRAESMHVLAIDSVPRAVQCTKRTAELNGVSISTSVDADGLCDAPGTYDCALANPPYYSNFRIATIFLAGANRALRSGGRLYVVTKHPAWYAETLPRDWHRIGVQQHRGYSVFTAYKP